VKHKEFAMETVDIECRSCEGSGLYSGMCEPKGVAVICYTCKGSGCEKFLYKPFIKRKPRTDITTVRRSTESTISYQRFQQGVMP